MTFTLLESLGHQFGFKSCSSSVRIVPDSKDPLGGHGFFIMRQEHYIPGVILVDGNEFIFHCFLPTRITHGFVYRSGQVKAELFNLYSVEIEILEVDSTLSRAGISEQFGR